jgi:hypothetical protein
MDFGQPNFLFRRDIIMESGEEDTIDVDFEAYDKENGWNSGKPLK